MQSVDCASERCLSRHVLFIAIVLLWTFVSFVGRCAGGIWKFGSFVLLLAISESINQTV